MQSKHSLIRGWPLVGMTALVLIVLIGGIVTSATNPQEAAHVAIRATARLSVALFVLAFTASAVWRLRPNAFTGWQRRNRRYLGVSFALSHFVHLGAILSLRAVAPHEFAALPAITWILGGLAYAFIAGMAATSFDRTARAVGPKAWAVLHTVGAYYIWLVFANSYLGRAFAMPEYIPVALIIVAALAVRIVAKMNKSQVVGADPGFAVRES